MMGLAQNFWKRIEKSPLAHRLAKGAFWSLAGSVISRGLGLLASIIVARLIGKHDFGQLAMLQSTIGMFSILAGFGLGMTATKHIAELRETDPDRAARVIGLSSLTAWITGGCLTILLIIFAPWLAENTLGSAEMTQLLRVGALLLVIGGLNGAQNGVLAGFEAYKTIARISVLAGLASFPLTIIGAVYFGVIGVIWAQVAVQSLNCGLNYIVLRRAAARNSIVLGYKNCKQEMAVLWEFSIPILITSASFGLATWIANAFLVNQVAGYSEMGIYNAVNQIKRIPELILGLVLAPMLPILSERRGVGDWRGYRKTLDGSFWVALTIVIPFALITAALPSLVLLPYGNDFEGGEMIIYLMMLHLILGAIVRPVGYVFFSMSRVWLNAGINIISGLVFVILSYLLVPSWGAVGLAAGYVLSFFITMIPSVYILNFVEKEALDIKSFTVMLVGAIVLYLVCVGASYLLRPLLAGIMAIVMVMVFAIIQVHRFRQIWALPSART